MRRQPPRFAPPAGIQFDAAANSGYQSAQSTYTFNRTCSGNNRFLGVDIEILSVPGTTVTSVIDDNGGGNVAMTFIGAKSTVSGAGRVECWGLIAPATGTKAIQVNLSASVASAAGAVSYTGVDQTTPTEAFNSAQATNVGAADATVNITTITNACWVRAAVVTDDTAITANQFSRNNVTGALGSGADEDNNAATSPAGVVTMSYTNIGALATWAIAGYAMRPVGTGLANGSVAFAGVGALNPVKSSLAVASVGFAGVGALNAIGSSLATASAAFAGIGAFNVSGATSAAGASDLQFAGVGSFIPIGATLAQGQVNFGGVGAFSPTVFVTPPVGGGVVPAGSPSGGVTGEGGRKRYKKPRRVVIGDKVYLVKSQHELDYIVDKVLAAPAPIKSNLPKGKQPQPITVHAPTDFVPAPLNPRNVEIAEHHASQEVREAIQRIEREIDEGEVAMLMQTAADNDRKQDEQILKLLQVLSGRKNS